jgi:hypothetical protein
MPTNPSDSVDTPMPDAPTSPDAILDVAVEYTFPASDPIAVEVAFAAAQRREAHSGVKADEGRRDHPR